jgi:hypothetical protein
MEREGMSHRVGLLFQLSLFEAINSHLIAKNTWNCCQSCQSGRGSFDHLMILACKKAVPENSVSWRPTSRVLCVIVSGPLRWPFALDEALCL